MPEDIFGNEIEDKEPTEKLEEEKKQTEVEDLEWKIDRLRNNGYVIDGSGAPSTTPESTGKIYVNKDNLALYMAADTKGSYNWAYIGKAATSAFKADTITGLKLWLTAGQGVTYDGANAVSGWNDQSGIGNHFVNGDAGSKPTYVTDLLNGRPGIQFDGVDDWLKSLSSSFILAQPATVFFVMKMLTIDGSVNIFLADGGGSPYYGIRDTNVWDQYAGGHVSAGAALSVPVILSFVTNAASSSSEINDDGAVTGDVSNAAWGGYLIMGQYNGADSYISHCNMHEILIYDTALSDANIEIVKTMLNNKYAIY